MRTFHDELKDMNGYSLMHNIPVQVVGTTVSRWGAKQFQSLAQAKKEFPTLDPFVNGKDFTWAMKDKVNGQDAMRFESWAANDMYST
jgi:hypothetical protein